MGLTDKLIELDEKIWNKVGAVTQYAYKEYGLSKYDLSKIVEKVTVGGFLGSAFYARARMNTFGRVEAH